MRNKASQERQTDDLSYRQLKRISKGVGDAFYLFDESRFRNNFRRLEAAFTGRYPRTRIAYSYKTNYMPKICSLINELGGYAEVVSEMEYEVAQHLSVNSDRIIYNGPCKSAESIRHAMWSGAIVNLDSQRDHEIASAVAASDPTRKFGVGLRCNFAIPGSEGSRFGVEVRGQEFSYIVDRIRKSPNLTLAGLHCHLPNRDLQSFQMRSRELVKLAREIFRDPPAFLDVGGGFFGNMPKSLARTYKVKPPTFEQYAKAIGDVVYDAYGKEANPPLLLIEPGTALVADTVRFYAKVVSLKEVRGRVIATVAGSIFNISPHARRVNLPVRVIRKSASKLSEKHFGKVDIAGYTCIEGDYLTRGLRGPIQADDFLEYGNVGSYSIVMKPPFILPNVAVLCNSGRGKQPRIIKNRETTDQVFGTFPGW